jgi:hypothetical protein
VPPRPAASMAVGMQCVCVCVCVCVLECNRFGRRLNRTEHIAKKGTLHQKFQLFRFVAPLLMFTSYASDEIGTAV